MTPSAGPLRGTRPPVTRSRKRTTPPARSWTADEPDLRWIGQQRRDSLLVAVEGVEGGQPAERQPGAPLDVGNARLRRLVPAEHVFIVTQEIFLRHRVARCTEFSGLIMDKRNDLPERTWNPHPLADRFVGKQQGSGKDRDAHPFVAGVVEGV